MATSNLISIFKNGNILAICSASNLKVWDASSGILEHEFHPGSHLASNITCLQFAPPPKVSIIIKK